MSAIERVRITFAPALSRPHWAVNRCSGPDGVGGSRDASLSAWDHWCVQPAARTLHGWAYGPKVAGPFRTKKEATAEARRRRALGPPNLDMVEDLSIAIAGKTSTQRKRIVAKRDAEWERSARP